MGSYKGILLIFAAPVLGIAIDLVNTTCDPERGNFDDQLRRATKSYVASTLRQSILFEKRTNENGSVIRFKWGSHIKALSEMLPRGSTPRTRSRNIAYVASAVDKSHICPHAHICRQDTLVDIIRIADRILDMLDWSPSAPDITAAVVFDCHEIISDAMPALHDPQEGGQQMSFKQLLGVPPERMCSLFHRIAYDPLASPHLHVSLLHYIATFVMHDYGEDIQSCFKRGDRREFWPGVQWAVAFTVWGDDDAPPDRDYTITQICLCWRVLFESNEEGVEQMAAKAVEDGIIHCLADWSQEPVTQAKPQECVSPLSLAPPLINPAL